MPEFPKPAFPFEYNLKDEIGYLRQHKQKRGIPKREKDRLLVATWNIANLGAQERRDDDISLLAEVISWFDIVAIQECRENFSYLDDIQLKLPKSYRVIMSDVAGNNERMVFLYDSKKLVLLEEIGEIAFPPADYPHIKLPGITQKFDGFDRTPYLAAFLSGHTSIMFVNVHLYFGSNSKIAKNRRSLETFAVARWAELRKKSQYSFTRELVVLGDFNMPKCKPGDPIYDALTKFGLDLPDHSTAVGSSIHKDVNYDQIAFLPETTQYLYAGKKGVFDFDAVIFPNLWGDGSNAANFKLYLQYYISDHRPMWVQLKVV